LSVSRETVALHYFKERRDKALRYSEILATTGIERGLIGPSEADRIWSRHIENCLPITTLFDQNSRVVDVGSGAGLPGIVIALARPDLKITLIEPLPRRVEFLKEVVAELEIPCEIIHGKAATVKSAFHHVTARAVAPLEKLILNTWHLIEVGGSLMAMKGERAQEEIDNLSQKIRSKPIKIELKELYLENDLTSDTQEGEKVSRIVLLHRFSKAKKGNLA